MVTFESDGSLTFSVYLPSAESVELIGDFTDWATRRLSLARKLEDLAAVGPVSRFRALDGSTKTHAAESGSWTIAIRVPEGEYAFSYLVDNQWWLPDYAAHGVRRNAEGSWTSLLFVPPQPRLLRRRPPQYPGSTARAMRDIVRGAPQSTLRRVV
jgi:1,4-alpha-glucan branching enzyme